MLRPDCLNLEAEGNYGLTVEAVRYRGSDTLVIFRGEDGSVWKKTVTGWSCWQPGDRVMASLDIREAVLFPDGCI